jgi:hypothetical protein
MMAMLMRTRSRERGSKADRAAAEKGEHAEDDQAMSGQPPHERNLSSGAIIFNGA